MVDIKLVINDVKTGKSYKKEANVDFVGIRIGEKVNGDHFGFKGYEFELTGGSDIAGFPMRKDIPGGVRKKALIGSGPGVHIRRKGVRLRKTVIGNTFGANCVQANLKVIKYGSEGLEKILGIEKKDENVDKK
ncbi:MAG: S6e family ribosomal protein [Nanoarchaeota archaeon]